MRYYWGINGLKHKKDIGTCVCVCVYVFACLVLSNHLGYTTEFLFRFYGTILNLQISGVLKIHLQYWEL